MNQEVGSFNRQKNFESHLFGDEPPPQHYEVHPETIQGLQAGNNNKRKAMDSHLFEETPPPAPMPVSTTENRRRAMDSHLFTDDSQQKSKYQPPQAQLPQNFQQRTQQQYSPPQNQQNPSRLRTNAPLQPLQPLQPLPPVQQVPPVQQNDQFMINRVPHKNPFEDLQAPLTPKFTQQLSQINDVNFRPSQRTPSQQTPVNLPPRTPLTAPHRAQFINTPVRKASIPNYDGIVQNTSIPQLSPFPDFQFDTGHIENNFHFDIKPLTSSGSREAKKLSFVAGTDMKKMRDELKIDAMQFENRMKQMDPSLFQAVQ